MAIDLLYVDSVVAPDISLISFAFIENEDTNAMVIIQFMPISYTVK